MVSVVLLGDSVFDNAAYVGDGPDVAAQLRAVLPSSSRVTLCAVDGTTTTDVGRQFDRVPSHATHLVLSLGGNDGLENADLLGPLAVGTMGEALDLLEERVSAFGQAYGWVLDALLDRDLPLTVCTIYDANLSGVEATRAVTALAAFNDVILRAAFERGLPVLDLRQVCTGPEHYANPIEPGAQGGLEIARAIAAALGVTAQGNASVVFGSANGAS